jgi:hypothetical protein
MDRPEATSRSAVGKRAAGARAPWAGDRRAARAGGRRAARAGGRRAGWARVSLCAAALGAIVLAGCGSISASSTGAATAASPKTSSSSPSPSVSPSAAATQAALCQHTATVTGLVITRNHLMRVPQLQAGFPGQVIVASPARARAAARAVCGLPSLPRSVFHCPNLTVGSTYLLRFTADGRQLPAVSIEATGCEVVTGVGPVRWAAKSPGFWRALATAANVSPPGRTAFTGGGTRSCQPISSRPDQASDCPAQNAPASGAVS